MDDNFTPVEPEFWEEPPKTPPEDPDYYGTGRQPRPKKSHWPLILALIIVLVVTNIVTLVVALHKDETVPSPTESIGLLTPDAGEEELAELDPAENTPNLDQQVGLEGIYDAIAPSTAVVVGQGRQGQTVNTGIILTEDGYLMTDANAAGQDLRVYLNDGNRYEAAFVGIDGDTAILKINAEGLTTVDLDREDNFRVEKVLKEIREKEAERVYLDVEISELTAPVKAFWHLPDGVYVESISPDSSAYQAGLREGDVLMRIGTREVWDIASYMEALQQCSWGDMVRISLYRNGINYRAEFRLEKMRP